MTLYHITDRLELLAEGKRTFFPRVPYSCSDSEDKTTPRICFAPSIPLAIQATGLDIHKGSRILVYELESEHLHKHVLIPPEELYEKQLVPDALENKEWWVTIPISMSPRLIEIEAITWKLYIAETCLDPEDVRKAISRTCIGIPPILCVKDDTKEILQYVRKRLSAKQYQKLKQELINLPYGRIMKASGLRFKEIKEVR